MEQPDSGLLFRRRNDPQEGEQVSIAFFTPSLASLTHPDIREERPQASRLPVPGSDDWHRFCLSRNLEPSMSRRGNCRDNAVAEPFFSGLKKERIHKRIYKTRDLARSDVFDYIEAFYNRTRRHTHQGGISPEAFERASA